MASIATSTRLIIGAAIMLVASTASPQRAAANADRHAPGPWLRRGTPGPVVCGLAVDADDAPLGSCDGLATIGARPATSGPDRLRPQRLADLPASLRERFPWAPAPAFDPFDAFEDSQSAWPARAIVRYAAAYVAPVGSARDRAREGLGRQELQRPPARHEEIATALDGDERA